MIKNYLKLKKKDRVYDENYFDPIDRGMVRSEILNGGNKVLNIHSTIWDRRTTSAVLYEMVGDEQGKCFRNGETHLATRPFLELRLKETQNKFRDYEKRELRQGKGTPKEWPVDLLKERLNLEAKLFVMDLEIEELERRLKSYKEADKLVSDKKLEGFKPLGQGVLRNGRLITIDDLNVSEITLKKNDDPIIVIDDERMPMFDGFSTADYFEHIVTPWKQACEAQAKINRAKALKDGVSYDKLSRGLRLGTNAPIPDMPQAIQNYKKVLETVK